MLGHVATGVYLCERMQKIPFAKRWWCGGEKQTRYRLACEASMAMRRWVGKACKWEHPRAPQVKTFFEKAEVTSAVLTFVRATK